MSPLPPSLEVFVALERHALQRPDSPAVGEGDVRLCFAQLAARVAGLAEELAALPEVIGVLAPNSVDAFVAALALAYAGKTFVPLPYFFSPQQLGHIVADSGLRHILTVAQWADKAARFGLPVSLIGESEANFSAARQKPGQRIIYTSGTTGQPKGVRLGAAQINASTVGLAQAVKADPKDVYLSILPFPLLLEQVCGIHAPVLAGASVILATDAAAGCAEGNPELLIRAAERAQPTISVLVPELLRAWVAGLSLSGRKAPSSLRFLAVGGAPVSPTLAEAGWALGLPVHEGYGLSECCSVVALNRPGDRTPGTVGKPLSGLTVTIESGEIVVEGATVMDGYLGRDASAGRWATGDLGDIDATGNLIIHGRKDNILVLATGRNVSPEWVEGLLTADPRLGRAIVLGHGEPTLTAVVTPSPLGVEWFAKALPEDVGGLIAALCADAPVYARPGKWVVAQEKDLAEKGLLTANGRPRRPALAQHFLGSAGSNKGEHP